MNNKGAGLQMEGVEQALAQGVVVWAQQVAVIPLVNAVCLRIRAVWQPQPRV